MSDSLTQLHQFFTLCVFLEQLNTLNDLLKKRYHIVICLGYDQILAQAQFFTLFPKRVNGLYKEAHCWKFFQILKKSCDDFASCVVLETSSFLYQSKIFFDVCLDQLADFFFFLRFFGMSDQVLGQGQRNFIGLWPMAYILEIIGQFSLILQQPIIHSLREFIFLIMFSFFHFLQYNSTNFRLDQKTNQSNIRFLLEGVVAQTAFKRLSLEALPQGRPAPAQLLLIDASPVNLCIMFAQCSLEGSYYFLPLRSVRYLPIVEALDSPGSIGGQALEESKGYTLLFLVICSTETELISISSAKKRSSLFYNAGVMRSCLRLSVIFSTVILIYSSTSAQIVFLSRRRSSSCSCSISFLKFRQEFYTSLSLTIKPSLTSFSFYSSRLSYRTKDLNQSFSLLSSFKLSCKLDIS